MTRYDTDFFKYVNSGAIISAEEMLPIINEKLNLTSILDVGCGQGAWLSIWRKLGIEDLIGIDGEYVDKENLLIEKKSFISKNLENEFNLQRKFDLVQSLEVAEHLPERCSHIFVENLIKHGEVVLFSAAPKGQGGDGHLNEQEYHYWRKIFSAHNYILVDFLRELIRDNKKIESWYRYNAFLYVSKEKYDSLPENIKKYRIKDTDEIIDISPPLYKIRKKFVKLLPVVVMNKISKVKERVVTILRKRNKVE